MAATRLPHPWDSPGKNTGVGCHFLLRCMKVKSESGFAKSCPTLSDPMSSSLPGSSIHGIFQAKGTYETSSNESIYALEHHKMRRQRERSIRLVQRSNIPGCSVLKNPPANADEGSIPGLGRSPRERNGNPLQYSCLENPMDREPGRLQFMRSQSWTLLSMHAPV